MDTHPGPDAASQETQQPQMVRIPLPSVTPYVTYTLLGLTVFIYLVQAASLYLVGPAIYNIDWPSLWGEKINALIRLGQFWRLITPVFLHGSVLHIAFNMYALFIFGRGLESRYGHLRFTALYFLSALSGNVLSFVLTPEASLGASTAIFGLITAEGIFLFQNRKLLGHRVESAILNIVMVVVINLFFGMSPGVDNWGHVGGMLGGMLFAWFGGPRWKIEGTFPSLYLTDERRGRGLLAGVAAVLLIFVPVAAAGWLWPV